MSQCPADVPVINKDHWASLYSAVKALESMTGSIQRGGTAMDSVDYKQIAESTPVHSAC